VPNVLRLTPMVALDDIMPAVERYLCMGFRRVDTEDPGCVGMRAGDSGVILASALYLSGDFRADHVQRMVGRTTAYIHVTSVENTRIPDTAKILDDVRTRGGTREVLVDDGGDLFILAEAPSE
jgi:hypothetical protein